MPCDFCGGTHGDTCPEFANFPGVQGNMEDFLDVGGTWRCSGMCGKVEQMKTAEALLSEGWIFTSKNGFIWASCPECGSLDQRQLERNVEKWRKAGRPRDNN